jgi:signal transduction histidine kinase
MPDGLHARHQAVLHALADRVVLALQIDESQKRLKTNQMLSTLGGLDATLLHRLKNDLLGISVYFDRMKNARDAGDVDLALKHAGKLGRLSETFLEQVTRLRDWSKAESERVDLGHAVQRGLELASVPTDVIHVEYDVPEHFSPVMGNESLLAEVYAILIKNAVEAMMPHGGRLRVHGQCQGPKDADWVVVRVKDDGTGIDDKTMKSLFRPQHSSKQGGLGVGLWLAHSYIELLGGRLEVESTEVNRGTTFIAGLPRAAVLSRTEVVETPTRLERRSDVAR